MAWDKGELSQSSSVQWCYRHQVLVTNGDCLVTEATSVKRPERFTRMDEEIAHEKLGDEEGTNEKLGEEPRVVHV